jgi:hypothetical protein
MMVNVTSREMVQEILQQNSPNASYDGVLDKMINRKILMLRYLKCVFERLTMAGLICWKSGLFCCKKGLFCCKTPEKVGLFCCKSRTNLLQKRAILL